MIETTQLYICSTQEELDAALQALSVFDAELYTVLQASDGLLHVWFADVETVMLPFCNTMWPPAPPEEPPPEEPPVE